MILSLTLSNPLVWPGPSGLASTGIPPTPCPSPSSVQSCCWPWIGDGGSRITGGLEANQMAEKNCLSTKNSQVFFRHLPRWTAQRCLTGRSCCCECRVCATKLGGLALGAWVVQLHAREEPSGQHWLGRAADNRDLPPCRRHPMTPTSSSSSCSLSSSLPTLQSDCTKGGPKLFAEGVASSAADSSTNTATTTPLVALAKAENLSTTTAAVLWSG